MSRLILTAAVLAIMVYAMVLGVRWLSPKIEQDIANRTTTALAEQGLLWADVAVEGRKVTLSGTAPTEESANKALAAASRVFGVAQVENALTLASGTQVLTKAQQREVKAYTLTIEKQGEKVSLSGNVASEADKAVLLRLAATHYNGEQNVDSQNLAVIEGAPAGWRTAAGTVLFNITNLEEAQITLAGTEIMVSGTVLDEQFSTQMENAIKATLPESYKVAFAVETITPTAVAPSLPVISEEATPTTEGKTTDASKINLIEPAAGEGCEAVAAAKNEQLLFAFDKADLNATHQPVVAKVAQALKSCAAESMVLAGFTDVTGSPLYNKWLSQQRAESTLRGLMRQGVEKQRLKAIGYGESYPVASNATRAGRAQNRRVEFHPGTTLPYEVKAMPTESAPAVKPTPKAKPASKPTPKAVEVSTSKIQKPWWAKQDAATSKAASPTAPMPELEGLKEELEQKQPKKPEGWLGDNV